MNLVALIMLLAVLQSLLFGGLVGYARNKYNVAAPAMSGHELFDRYFRVHYNTNELLIVLLPALWLFGSYLNAPWAAALGAVYLLGRCVYAVSYISSPKKRSAGFGLSFLPIVILLLGAVFGVIRSLVAA